MVSKGRARVIGRTKSQKKGLVLQRGLEGIPEPKVSKGSEETIDGKLLLPMNLLYQGFPLVFGRG
jgi:hypothetical protein